MTCARVFAPGETCCRRAGQIASASSTVSVLDDPWPCRTPPNDQLPAFTRIMFVPADLTWSSICVCAPVPSATIVITAATPMIIPSIVNDVRSLFLPSALSAMRTVIRSDMIFVLGWRQGSQFLGGEPARLDRLIADDPAVAE